MDDWRTSVLMAVYHREQPSRFARALESIFTQTLPPDEVIVVEDGPLGERLSAVLDGFEGRGIALVRVALPENRGLAAALDAGLAVARFPWIVRMDSDDVSLPHRLQTQMDVLRQGGVDVLGTAMAEFDGDEEDIVGTRMLPLDPRAISRYARINNPMNHPSVIMRRSAIDEAGGYRGVPFMEDYDLFARMLALGAVLRNLSEPLVLFRAGDAMLSRRSAPGMFDAERLMQRNLVRYGLVSRPRAWANLLIRTCFRSLPRTALRRAYARLFYTRRSTGTEIRP